DGNRLCRKATAFRTCGNGTLCLRRIAASTSSSTRLTNESLWDLRSAAAMTDSKRLPLLRSPCPNAHARTVDTGRCKNLPASDALYSGICRIVWARFGFNAVVLPSGKVYVLADQSRSFSDAASMIVRQ